jgi:hypothetical protein
MVILRVISVLLIVIALMLLGADVVSSLEQSGGGTVLRSFSRILMLFGFDAEQWLAQHLPPQFVQICIRIISGPGWVVVGVPGALLGLLSAGRSERRPPPKPPALPPIHR